MALLNCELKKVKSEMVVLKEENEIKLGNIIKMQIKELEQLKVRTRSLKGTPKQFDSGDEIQI